MSESLAARRGGGPSARVVLVRHGESRWNAARVFQGQQCAGLSERGFAQADALGAYLPATYPDVVLVARSDIDRVAQTAAPAEKRIDVPVRVDARWREIDLGAWAGQAWDDVAAVHADDVAAWVGCDASVRPGGGETLIELRERVWAGLREVVAETLAAGGGTALVFTHGGPIRTSVAGVLGLHVGGERAIQPVRNASLTELRADADGAVALVGYNGLGHLEPHLA